MARKAATLGKRTKSTFNAPAPRQLASLISWLCTEDGITRSQLLWRAVNGYAVEHHGLDPLDESIIENFKAYEEAAA